MIRVLVFVVSLGLMISSGLLIGARSITATDNPADKPPSLQKEYDSYSYLAASDVNEETVLLVE
jgi:hypothetical protein